MRARLLCLLSLTCACSAGQSDFAPSIAQLEQPIVQGMRSDGSEDATVYVSTRFSPTDGHQCTGTLVAPNLVITALHCVTENELSFFGCNADGTLQDNNRVDGTLGRLADPASVSIFTGLREHGVPAGEPPAAVGARLFGTGSTQICRNDLALLQLDREIDAPVAPIRLNTTVRWGDTVRVVGYGLTDYVRPSCETDEQCTDGGSCRSGTCVVSCESDEQCTGDQSCVLGDCVVTGRFTRSGVRVTDVGPLTDGEATRTAAPRTFVTNEGACHGDSGGPAFDDETGALLGIYSLSAGETCQSVGIRNVYTHLNPFSSFILDAFAESGAEPLLEDDGTEEDPVPTAAADDGGCSMRKTSGSSAPAAGGLALLAAALLIRSARRRR